MSLNTNNPETRGDLNFGLFTLNIRGHFPRLITIFINNGTRNLNGALFGQATGHEDQIGNNGSSQNQILLVRERIFRSIFTKVAILYSVNVSRRIRSLIEYGVLFFAFLSLLTLSYLHVKFIRRPINCLESIQEFWQHDDILRLEIINPYGQKEDYYNLINRDMKEEMLNLNEDQSETSSSNSTLYSGENLFKMDQIENVYPSFFKTNLTYFQMLMRMVWPQEHYIVEYSLEYGFLRLTPKIRQKLNISVKVVTLNPNQDKCFGNQFSRFLLQHFLGYDDILMGSLKTLAEKQDNKGYVRNLVTREHYRFVNIYMTRSAYFAALFIMIVFTLSISMLLRYSHHQVFIFVTELLQMLEFNIGGTFPFAPLLTVILALIGMEAIMSEFFNDTTTAFYVILIVWAADQYDALCCHTLASRRHWLKFFYLYHFLFYAYDYRFNGQYSNLALLTSWLFIQHSMIYFFHRYELPSLLASPAARVILSERLRRSDFENETSNDPIIEPPNESNHFSSNNSTAEISNVNDSFFQSPSNINYSSSSQASSSVSSSTSSSSSSSSKVLSSSASFYSTIHLNSNVDNSIKCRNKSTIATKNLSSNPSSSNDNPNFD